MCVAQDPLSGVKDSTDAGSFLQVSAGVEAQKKKREQLRELNEEFEGVPARESALDEQMKWLEMQRGLGAKGNEQHVKDETDNAAQVPGVAGSSPGVGTSDGSSRNEHSASSAAQKVQLLQTESQGKSDPIEGADVGLSTAFPSLRSSVHQEEEEHKQSLLQSKQLEELKDSVVSAVVSALKREDKGEGRFAEKKVASKEEDVVPVLTSGASPAYGRRTAYYSDSGEKEVIKPMMRVSPRFRAANAPGQAMGSSLNAVTTSNAREGLDGGDEIDAILGTSGIREARFEQVVFHPLTGYVSVFMCVQTHTLLYQTIVVGIHRPSECSCAVMHAH